MHQKKKIAAKITSVNGPLGSKLDYSKLGQRRLSAGYSFSETGTP
jgi:hypothetical protein